MPGHLLPGHLLPGHLLAGHLLAGRTFTAARELHDRLAVTVEQRQLVARVDEMWIADLRIQLPDFRPAPRFHQEVLGDVPKGIAFLDDVAGRVIRVELDALGQGQKRHQQGRQKQAECFLIGHGEPCASALWVCRRAPAERPESARI